jgi:hypothetical protein
MALNAAVKHRRHGYGTWAPPSSSSLAGRGQRGGRSMEAQQKKFDFQARPLEQKQPEPGGQDCPFNAMAAILETRQPALILSYKRSLDWVYAVVRDTEHRRGKKNLLPPPLVGPPLPRMVACAQLSSTITTTVSWLWVLPFSWSRGNYVQVLLTRSTSPMGRDSDLTPHHIFTVSAAGRLGDSSNIQHPLDRGRMIWALAIPVAGSDTVLLETAEIPNSHVCFPP